MSIAADYCRKPAGPRQLQADGAFGHGPPGRQKSRRSGFFAIARCGRAFPDRAKNPKAPRASADPGSSNECFAGCEVQHQQTAFAKKKQ
jgi:hypothetical protein